MAKNPNRSPSNNPAHTSGAPKPGFVSKRGRKVIGLGIGLVVLGFWILTLADPAGQNWASTASPALLVLGYTLIGIGIVLPDPALSSSSPQT